MRHRDVTAQPNSNRNEAIRLFGAPKDVHLAVGMLSQWLAEYCGLWSCRCCLSESSLGNFKPEATQAAHALHAAVEKLCRKKPSAYLSYRWVPYSIYTLGGLTLQGWCSHGHLPVGSPLQPFTHYTAHHFIFYFLQAIWHITILYTILNHWQNLWVEQVLECCAQLLVSDHSFSRSSNMSELESLLIVMELG